MIVLTLGGMNYGRTDEVGTALHQHAKRRGVSRKIVDYPQAATAQSIPLGVVALDTALRNTPEDCEIVAHSQGCEVVGEWMRRYAGRPDAPTHIRRIILLGNPERRFGGAMGYQFGNKKRQPTPETQYRVDDIARKGDPWANADGVSLWARLTRSLWAPAHRDYDDIDADNPGVLRRKSGNTSYWVSQ